MQLRVFHSITEISRLGWDGLLDSQANPFVSWSFLEALESSGCATAETGWTPSHLTLWNGATLVAAAPAYLKSGDSDGDFSRDWGWAESAARAGVPYYPKLQITVPFTPVTGRRILVAQGSDRMSCVKALVDGAKAAAGELGATSVHVLFPLESEALELETAGLSRRVSYQYHWKNEGYREPEEFLLRFDSKRRNAAKRERAAPAAQGIAIRTVRGDEIAADPKRWAQTAFELHRSTVEKLMWGRGWLNADFYQRLFRALPEALELVLATRQEKIIAGAFNVATPSHLFGRYWGCFEDHKFLHFNVCLYHSIDECIRRGVQVFEGGAGGEHKLVRGFEPAETWSAHWFRDRRLQVPLSSYIAREAEERATALMRWRADSPIFKHRIK